MSCCRHFMSNSRCNSFISCSLNQSLSLSFPIGTKNRGTIRLLKSFKSSISSIVFMTSSSVSSGNPTISVQAGTMLASVITPAACFTISGYSSGLNGFAFAGIAFFTSSGEPVSMPISAPHHDCFSSMMISATLSIIFGFVATAAKEA